MKKALKYIPVILYSALIFGISSIPGNSIPSQVTPYSLAFHFVLYFLYSFTIIYWLKNPYYAYTFGVVYAASDEIHQYFVPGRSCDPVDFTVDTIALASGILLMQLLSVYKKSKIEKLE